MNERVIRWLLAPRYVRWLSLLVLCMGSVALMALLCWQPQRETQQKLSSEVRQQVQRYQALWRQLRQQPTLRHILLKNTQLNMQQQQTATLFSLATLLDQSGGELESWQPGEGKIELMLLVSWEQIQQVFAYFTTLTDTACLEHFIIQRHGERLRAHFTLDTRDDT